MKKKAAYESILAVILILLWVYTAGTKLTHFDKFKSELFNQVFSRGFASVLLYLIPTAELIAGLLLLKSPLRLAGFTLSFLLMALFTGYVGLILLGYYDRVPCSCAGIIQNMGWSAHLIFNILFMAIAIVGIIITYKNRRAVTTMKTN